VEFESSLPDGRPLWIRPIRPDDKGLLKEGLERLSPESRYRRFFHQIDRLSDSQLQYLTEVDGRDHVAYLCLLADTGEGVGVARWVRMPNEPEIAEGAVTVLDEFHNMGVGKTLLYVLAREAIANDIRAFRAWVVGENVPMLMVLKELGAVQGRWEYGTTELTLPLPDSIEELEETAAPLVLKLVARGEMHGAMHPDRPQASVVRPAHADQPINP
jgi:GNAT superfamily N-acetyltransferase